jgi:hypothetical protein
VGQWKVTGLEAAMAVVQGEGDLCVFWAIFEEFLHMFSRMRLYPSSIHDSAIPIPRLPTVYNVQIAIRVDIRVPQISPNTSQENLGLIVGPSQHPSKQSKRIRLHSH